MLLPALETARKTARRIECLIRQKQFYYSVSYFLNDYDGRWFTCMPSVKEV